MSLLEKASSEYLFAPPFVGVSLAALLGLMPEMENVKDAVFKPPLSQRLREASALAVGLGLGLGLLLGFLSFCLHSCQGYSELRSPKDA
jgi:hypothetical protein